QSVLQERAASVEREAVSLREQKRRLIEIFDATGRITGVAQNNLTPEQAQLARLEDELRRSLAIYSPENPKIKIIQAQIAQQESLVASASGIDPADSQSQATLMDIQLAAIDSRVDLLGEQRTRLEAQLVALLDSIQRTPANSIMLQSFDRDYQNIQQQYNTAVDRLAKAATGERIELLSKGQRIAILDPATAPSAPTSPNRALISIGGTVGGALLGLGLVVLLEILNASIRRPADITRRMGITPLATVPYIRTPMELVVRRAVFVLVFSVLAIGLPAALYVVHTYYLPLDLIYDRIAGKIGAVL
ncbi:MAG: lipopolysaccharide biosynthesis protein, partial [Paracoccaceae bacterium]